MSVSLTISEEELDARAAMEAFGLIDQCEVAIAALPAVEIPVCHVFTPGLYSREVHMPAGAVLTSKIHKTQHQFVVSQGVVAVWERRTGVQIIQAPFTGITQPGTRRVLMVHEDTIWTTFHPTDKNTVEEVEADIIQPHNNQLLE